MTLAEYTIYSPHVGLILHVELTLLKTQPLHSFFISFGVCVRVCVCVYMLQRLDCMCGDKGKGKGDKVIGCTISNQITDIR